MACSLSAAAADALARDVRALLRQALPGGGRVAVGYSGGEDSTVLLAIAASLGMAEGSHEISAVHVNHGIHPDAPGWERHCQRRCSRWGVPLRVCRAEVLGRAGMEEKARDARHAAWRRLDVDAVMLAHHADDQAETVLLRAMRGAGARGMGSMRRISALPGSTKLLLRPLLDAPRSDLRRLAKRLRIRAISDPANHDLSINRSWLRHKVLPEAAKRFPGSVAALNSVAANAAQADELLAQLAEEDDRSARRVGGVSRKALSAKGRARVANWLRWQLEQRGIAAPARRHLEEAVRQLCEAGDGFEMDFPGQRLSCRRGLLDWRVAAAPRKPLIDKIAAN